MFVMSCEVFRSHKSSDSNKELKVKPCSCPVVLILYIAVWTPQGLQEMGTACRTLSFCAPTEGWRSTGSPGGSSFLSQPAEWWEPGTGQPKMVCYFYHSLLNLRAAPWRPVAGSSPQAAEFNPRTALPRGDGKHLASCLTTRPGCPASVLSSPIRLF